MFLVNYLSPRQRPNGLGEISPVSFKRKLRDLVEDHKSPVFQSLPEKFREHPEEYCILESRGRDRKAIQKEMEIGGDIKKFDQDAFLSSKFVKKYWDARVFGNTFLEEGGNKGYIKTGVVQIGMGISISPINIIRQTNTNKAGVQDGKNAGMAPMAYRVVAVSYTHLDVYKRQSLRKNPWRQTNTCPCFILLTSWTW